MTPIDRPGLSPAASTSIVVPIGERSRRTPANASVTAIVPARRQIRRDQPRRCPGRTRSSAPSGRAAAPASLAAATQAVKHEHARRERQDRATTGRTEPPGNSHRQHGSGQDQQAVVGDRVCRVDEHDLPGWPSVMARFLKMVSRVRMNQDSVSRWRCLANSVANRPKPDFSPFERAPRPMVGYAHDYAGRA